MADSANDSTIATPSCTTPFTVVLYLPRHLLFPFPLLSLNFETTTNVTAPQALVVLVVLMVLVALVVLMVLVVLVVRLTWRTYGVSTPQVLLLAETYNAMRGTVCLLLMRR